MANVLEFSDHFQTIDNSQGIMSDSRVVCLITTEI